MLTDLCRSQLNDRNNSFPFHAPLTDTVDCNVAMTSQAVELVTGHQLTARDTRALGKTPNGPTGIVLARLVFTAMEMEPLSQWQTLRNVSVQTVRDALQAKWAVTLFIDNGHIIDHAPDLVGARGYRGPHAVMLFDWWRGEQGVMVHVADPTFDGRKRGKWTAPKEVQKAPFALYRDAAYSYMGRVGSVSGHMVKPKGG